MKKRLLASVLCVLGMPLSALAATQYRVTDLGVGYDTRGLNDTGQVVASQIVGGLQRSFLYSGGSWSALGVIAGRDAGHGYSVEHINNNGWAVGESYAGTGDGDNGSDYQSFAWDATAGMRGLGTPPYGAESGAMGSNGGNTIAGVMGTSTAGGGYRAYLWQNGGYTDLSAHLAAGNSEAAGINDSGQIAGHMYYAAGGSQHFFLNPAAGGYTASYLALLPGESEGWTEDMNNNGWVAVTGENLTTNVSSARIWDPVNGVVLADSSLIPNVISAGANGLNDAGQAVGWVRINTPFGERGGGWLWDGTPGQTPELLSNLLVPGSGWNVWGADDINNNGVILARGALSGSPEQHVLLLTPVPEPETWGLLLAGLGLVAWRMRSGAR